MGRKTYIIWLFIALLASCGGPQGGDDVAISPTSNKPIESPLTDNPLGLGAEPPKVSNFGSPPLSFEPNQGQTDSQVKFLTKVNGYNLYITGTEMVFDVVVREPSVEETLLIAPDAIITQPGESAAVKFSLLGANQDAAAEGINKQAGLSNYFIGNDSSKWITDIEQYEGVLVKNIYEGINLRFYAAGNVVEHDFIVAPGVSPDLIQMQVLGAKMLYIAEDGDLEVVLNEEGTKLTVKKPFAYQGSSQTPVESAYKLINATTIGFTVGTYDSSQELVIDPVTVVYSGFLGGTLDDVGITIALDSTSTGCTTAGLPCAVIAGYTKSTNFPTASAFQGSTGGGNFDAFLMRLTSTGGGPTYSTYLGGSGDDLVSAVKIDGSGNVYITGYTTSTNFPTTGGVLQTANAGGYDAFITKLPNTGASLTYSTYFGTSGFDSGMGIALDTRSSGCTTAGSACAVIIGSSVSTGLNTAGVANTTGDATNGDAYVMRLSSDATSKTVATYLGGTGGRDVGLGIAIDPADTTAKVFVTGETKTSNTTFLPAPSGTFQTNLSGTRDAFVVKLDAALTTTGGYSTYLGGTNNETPGGIALDTVSTGCTSTTGAVCAVIVGTTLSTDFPTANANDASSNGGKDAFITKFNPTAVSPLTYSTYVGGSGDDEVVGLQSIAVDGNGEAWVTGKTSSTESTFPDYNATGAYPGSTTAAFVAKLAGGTTSVDLSFATYHGGTSAGSDLGAAIAVDASASNCYIAGIAESTTFPTAGSPFDTTHNGAKDGFTAKFTTPPITVVNASSATTSGTPATSLSIAMPTNTTQGDVMIMGVLISADTETVTTPTGWTLITNQANAGGNNNSDGNIYAFYKVAGASEAGPYSIPVSATLSIVAGIVTLRNVNPTNPLDPTAATTATSVSGTAHAAPSITAVFMNDMLVTIHGVNVTTTWTPPPDDADTPGATAMTEQVDTTANATATANDNAIEISTTLKAAAGASLTKTATSAASGVGEEITVSFSER